MDRRLNHRSGAPADLPDRIVVEERAGALATTGEWRRRSTTWTDGLRPDSGVVGAACTWKSPGGWTGRRFHLGINKEIFDAEAFAIYQALQVLDRLQESGHRYTVFVDCTAVIDRARTDALGPGQRFVIVGMEVCGRVFTYDKEVTIRSPK